MLKQDGNLGNVRRTLVFHNALIAQLKEKYRSTTQPRVKHVIAMLTRGNILKKYKMLERTRRVLSCHTKNRKFLETLAYKRKKRSDVLGESERQEVLTFYERDDVSRMMPGKKDTITKMKNKKQRRILSDSMKVLHVKFCYENPQIQISYALFCSLRPFWVTVPKLADRNTCLCKRHDNIQLMVNRLHSEGVFQTNVLSDQYVNLVCDETNQECMYGTCSICLDKQLPRLNPALVNKEVRFSQWITKEQERNKYTANGTEKIQVKVTLKETQDCRLSDLHEKFEAEIKPRLTTHVFNIRHQYTTLRRLRESLQADEIILHVDFSENYSCKSSDEVQSVHFGASHKQVTLHTGVAYTMDQKIPFCSISKSTRHDPAAIWAHLRPVLEKLLESRRFTTAHFITDGPTTQYRNKKNFYLASTIPSRFGISWVSWNFLEAGHGKGAADGIGGAVKRSADRLVAEGKDIPDADALFETLLPSSTILLFMVREEDIRSIDDRIPGDLRPLPGTMKLHQV